MSDLISRLSLKDRASEYALSADEYKRLCKIIDTEPTAYDIDKVVEELERHKDTTDLTTVDEEMIVGFTTYQGAFNEAIYKAIEIVKQGNVSDDMCEWKKYPFDWFTGCDGYKINHKQGDYCPRCGKKIKIVGD